MIAATCVDIPLDQEPAEPLGRLDGVRIAFRARFAAQIRRNDAERLGVAYTERGLRP